MGSLSQNDGNNYDSEEVDDDEQETDEPAAKRLFNEEDEVDDAKLSSKPPVDDCMDDIFASNAFDDELVNIGARVEAKHSSKKDPPGYNSNTNNIDEDLGSEANRLPMKNPAESSDKRQQGTLFQTVTKKCRRKSSSGSMSSVPTLTQHFPSVKREKLKVKVLGGGTNETPSTARKIISGLVEIRLRGKMTTFKKGDVWLPYDKACREKGFAFTLGDISTVGMHYDAAVIAWMKIEHAFIGREEAARVKACTGSDWVLVKKHDMLPQRIQLNRLLHRITDNLPDKATTLCYEQEGKIAHSFYYECKTSSRKQSKNDKPCALDLFAGAGGTSIGLEKAGIDVKYKVEMNKTASYTLQINFPGSHIFSEDIAKFLQSCKTQRVKIYPRRGQVIYIHGQHFQPSFVSMENVPGLGQDKNIKYLLQVVGGLLGLSYQVRTCLVKSSEFGDPQARCRVIVLASKKGYILPTLKPTHGEGRLKIVTAGDVLRDLKDIDPVPDLGLVDLPNGAHVWDHCSEGTDLKEKSDDHYVLNANQPANTVRKGNQMRHYKHDRYITVRERARLQQFPDSHRFAGSKKERFNQIGNAVPVGLAEAIGRAVMESYHLGRHES
ncbi:hypothetical protein ACHAXR_011751 [Thalassiosira sp. AJA248-18]